ncbi:MAG: DUF1836 domain-containing protein [Eubacterium sp.]|nr:DUF1836 domain-containing protein [Eubacterium sp.]
MERKNQEKKINQKLEREKEQELKKEIRDKLMLDFIVPEDIPTDDMFMEQVTTFMEQHLKANLRNEEEKTLTKAMINNYTKNKLMPPPVKKRYSREHLIFLIYIYYMKNVMSISDIQKMMEPLMSEDMTDEKLYDIYKKTFEMEKAEYFNIEDSVIEASRITDRKLPKSEDERLNKMLYIFMLGYDVYSKKRLIEKLIDELD